MTLRSLCINCVCFREDYCSKLNNKVFKTWKIQILVLSFILQLNIDISDQILNLVVACQEEELVVFEELDKLDCIDELFSGLVVFKIVDTFYGVHGGSVFEEQESENSVEFFKKIVNIVDIPLLH